MTDAAEVKKQGDDRTVIGRGPAYPFISLRKAVERAEQLRDANLGRAAASPLAIYRVWGWQGSSGDARQTLAALNHYGLTQYIGRGDDRQVKLTELAHRIIFDKVPGSKERLAAVRQAALMPGIHAKLWKQYQFPLPPPVALETFLVRDCKFSEGSAKNVIGIYRDTLDFAEVNSPDSMPLVNQGNGDVAPPLAEAEVGDRIQWESDGVLKLQAPARVRAIQEHAGQKWVFVEGSKTGIPMNQVRIEQKGSASSAVIPPTLSETPSAGTRREVFGVAEGDVVISFPENLSPESYEDLEAYLELFLRKAKRRAEVEVDRRRRDREDVSD
jgi:hypothetical protein